MDSYEDCPTCGRLVQQGRVCRYCAQTAVIPQRERVGEDASAAPQRPGIESAQVPPSDSGWELQPIKRWALIALAIAVVAALIAAAVIWGVLD
jgi:hypothetical protein